ncbi:MAG TPA: asparaginase [Candidatus Magasanikbacteria bacterium]|nr:asparaginase [Candidatus Magasanikbacteria bacterium]
MPNKNTIHIILTGGTIDSHYDGTKDTAITNRSSVVPDFIKSLKLYEKTEYTEICMKDSRHLTKADLKKILNTIEKSPYKKIIITHGTYTMPDTARYLNKHLKRKDQTIIFTGSMIPLVGFTPSDAPFNLGYSIAKVQDMEPSISVCMNGKNFQPDEVAKLLYEGKFISLFNK